MLFNQLDYEILREVFKKPIPVMQLKSTLGRGHNSLKCRLDKLANLKLIKKNRVESSRINLLTIGKKRAVKDLLKLFK